MTAAPPAPALLTARPSLPRWAGFALWTIAGLALFVLTVWSVAYFGLASSDGRALLLESARLPEGVSVGVVRWGPVWDEVVVGDVRVVDGGARELVHVRSATIDLGLGAFMGGDIVVDRLEVDVAQAQVRERDGAVDLVAIVAPPKAPTTASGTPKPPAKQPVIDRFIVNIGEVFVDGGGAYTHLRDVVIAGRIIGDDSSAEVDIGTVHAAWDKWRRHVAFADVNLRAHIEENGVHVGLALGPPEDPSMAIEGRMKGTGDDATSQWRGWGRVDGRTANALVGGFPLGFDFDGLEVVTAGKRLTGSIGSMVVPYWESGPFSGDHIALGISRFAIEPALLVPKAELDITGLSAAHLSGLDWTFAGLWLPTVEADLDKKLLVTMAGASASWKVPQGEVGAVDLLVAAELKLSGGPIEVQLRTPQGLVEATGTLKSSVLTKRTDFIVDMRFANVRGPLAQGLLHDLEDEQRVALGEGPSGSAEFEIEVDREDRFSPWQTELEWALGRLDSALCGRIMPCVSFEWDGYGWGAPATAESP